MSGKRRVDCKELNKSKCSDKREHNEEEINFQMENSSIGNKNFCDFNLKEILNEKSTKNVIKEQNNLSLLTAEEKNNVVFLTKEGKNEQEIIINQVEVVKCIKEFEEASYSSIDDSQKSTIKPKENTTVILKYIDDSVSIEDIQEFFRKCGEIQRVSIMFNKSTVDPKGYAAVYFNTIEGKYKALELNNSILKGKQIRVTEKNRRTPSYLTSKNKNIDYHAYLNNNQKKNKNGEIVNAVPNSIFGPVKARLVSRRNYEPY